MKIAQRLQIKRILIGLICLALFCGAFFFVLSAYNNDSTQRSSSFSFGADEKESNRMEVTATLLGADPVKGDLPIRISVVPKGSFAINDSPRMSQDLTFITTVEGAKSDGTLAKNKVPPYIDGTLSLYNGRVNDYPFDKHEADLYLYFVNPKNDQQSIPMSVDFNGSIPGFNVDADIIKGFDSEDNIGIKVHISRSIVTKIFAIFIMVAMWFVAIIVLTMSLAVLLQKRPIEPALFTYMGALLFALPAVRNIQPGVPPVGTLTDFLSFFWAETIIAASMGIMFYCWFTRYQPKT
ncbi:DUF4436 family protein [Pseudanabaena sp. PCC 6802]|uniref:DUF4436 family protein n=1 Tax=Pseudanabaena sp. PCC 6802 TaxID=118173 RepID=UPI000347A43B|nr:DUF4436 family protein [Pseudanabaena sp. PCC 6802]